MSTVTSIGGTGTTADALAGLGKTGSGTQSASSRNSISRDDFYKIMISELTNQDPLEPMDNQKFLEQLVSLQNLDSSSSLSDGIGQLLLQQKIAAGSSLIGREVRAPGVGSDGSAAGIQGTVARVQVGGGAVTLLLDGNRTVKMEDVVEIS